MTPPFRALALSLAAAAALLLVVPGVAGAQTTAYTDEAAYLSALAAAGYPMLTEGFEGAAWDGVRTTVGGGVHTAASITSQGITWSATDGVTTNNLFPYEGGWKAHDHPGGDPDKLAGTSAVTLYGVGGWFTTTTSTTVRLVLDGAVIDGANIVLTSGWTFVGVIAPAGFTTFEVRDTDATTEDPKQWFADAFTFGVGGGAPANSPPDGTITTPAGNVAAQPGEAVGFAGVASDPDGDAVTVVWSFGDGSTSTLPAPGTHAWTTAGTYTVTLTATDAHGLADPTPDTRTVTVTAANSPPDGTITTPAGNVAAQPGEAVGFAGSASDPDGDAVTVVWSFGDGSTSTLLAPGTHAWATAGTYTVTLTATDAHGLADPTPDTRTVTVTAANSPPDGTITTPAGNVAAQPGEAVSFAGSASDPDGDAVTVVWSFGDGSTSTLLAPGTHAWTTAGTYTVTLTATDAHGLADPTPDTRTVTVTDPQPEPSPTTGVVAAVAAGRGLAGSDWHTDLSLHNASFATATVELSFSPRGQPINAGDVHVVTLDPWRTSVLEDVVDSVFGATGSGAVHWHVVDGDPAAVLVSANTFNRVDGVRRFGQQVPGVRWTQTVPAGAPQLVPALAGRSRTNLGLATDHRCSQVQLRVRDRAGILRHESTVPVEPLSWIQFDDVFRGVFAGLLPDPPATPVAESLHTIEVTGLDGSVLAYASIIDNASNDGSFMLGQRPDVVTADLWLPTVAQTTGLNGSRWRSDLILAAWQSPATVAIEFYPAGADNSGDVVRRELTLPVGESVVLEDVLGTTFAIPTPAVGSLRLAPADGDNVLAWMRTFTLETAQDLGTVTYGQPVAPFAGIPAVSDGGEGVVHGFSHVDRTRSNLVLQNTRADTAGALLPATVLAELLDRTGTPRASRVVALGPGEYLQENAFVEAWGLEGLEGGALRLSLQADGLPAAGGGVVAAVSEVNGNRLPGTNDGRLLPAEPVPSR